MRNIFFLTCVLVACTTSLFSASAAPTEEKYAVTINLAGKQRMLSQKMVKEVLLIHLEIDTKKNRKRLKQSLELFTKTLYGLREGDKSLRLSPTNTQHISEQIDIVKLLFQEVEFIFNRVIRGQEPSRDALFEVMEKSPAILESMDRVVEMFEDEAHNTLRGDTAFLGIEINLAGKQRMLTQKMSKEALAVYLNINRRANKKRLRKSYTLFEKTLIGLKYGDDDLGLPGATDRNIVRQIDRVMKTWKKLKPAIVRSSDIMVDKVSAKDIQIISRLNVPLLNRMNSAVRMYEKLAKH
ncbi:MAG: type IV pili methyl-accepting chemotaxis transducer N-terminal domain-containing protein [Omnitrophica bacterium]|nr:type IV pili methyl-accepting chemotaxis transducer N-terminal domain-containing protein [Candidatus Omnitrophota bacterium]